MSYILLCGQRMCNLIVQKSPLKLLSLTKSGRSLLKASSDKRVKNYWCVIESYRITWGKGVNRKGRGGKEVCNTWRKLASLSIHLNGSSLAGPITSAVNAMWLITSRKQIGDKYAQKKIQAPIYYFIIKYQCYLHTFLFLLEYSDKASK